MRRRYTIAPITAEGWERQRRRRRALEILNFLAFLLAVAVIVLLLSVDNVKAADPGQRCDACRITTAPTPRPTPVVIGIPPATPSPAPTPHVNVLVPALLPSTDTDTPAVSVDAGTVVLSAFVAAFVTLSLYGFVAGIVDIYRHRND